MTLKSIIKSLSIIIMTALASLSLNAYAATNPPANAIFDTVLSQSLGTSDTVMYIKNVTDSQGNVLSGYQCFTVDVDTPSVEYVCGTISGTTVTGLVRNIGFSTATSTYATETNIHRVGADVRITDFPSLGIAEHQLAGVDTLNGIPLYSSSIATTTFTNRQQLIDKGYVDDIAFSGAGVINATTAAKGIVQFSTGLQAASSTVLGSSGANLSLPGSIATDTPTASCESGYSAKGAGCVVVGNTQGQLTFGISTISVSTFGATTTFTATTTMASSTTIGGTYAFDIGKHFTTFTSATTTWNVPSGIHSILVRMIGPGGTAGSSSACSGGGGGGGYLEAVLDVSATSSVDIVVNGTLSSVDGTLLQANEGNVGAVNNTGGSCSGGDGGSAATSTSLGTVVTSSLTATGAIGGSSYYDGTHTGGSGMGGNTAFGGDQYGAGGRGSNNPGQLGIVQIYW